MNTGHIFVVSAPSGAGKTSLVRALIEADGEIYVSVSHTTRPPRPGEVNGRDYYFVDESEFLAMADAGEFIETAQVYGNRYGTSFSAVERQICAGCDLLLEIDWQGAAQIRKRYPQATTIFVLPPSIECLMERLNARGQDSVEVIRRRLAEARADIAHVAEFDYVIINDVFDVAARDLISIIRVKRLKAARQLARHAELLTTLQDPRATNPDAPTHATPMKD